MNHHLTLRALEPEDLDLIYQIENDRELWKWSSTCVPISHHTVRKYLECQKNDIYLDGELRQVITVDNEAAGIVDLVGFEPRHLRAEVGIVILPAFHRRHIATEALQQLHDYTAHVLHLRCLYAYVAQDNKAGQTLFRSLGYEATGQLPLWLEGMHTVTLFQKML